MSSDPTKDIQSLLKKLPRPEPTPVAPAIDADQPILACFVASFLMWEATTQKAIAALPKLEKAVVDYNELRVCLPDELVEVLGERYPRVEERVLRLRAALNDLFRREHAVTLERLASEPKRQARAFLESLDGVPRYVAARTSLVALGAHAAPVDERLLVLLREAGVADEAMTEEGASSLLERALRAGELADAHAALQAWADDGADQPPKRTTRTRSRSTSRSKKSGSR